MISEAVEAAVALKPAQRANTIAVLIVDTGLQGHCPLVQYTGVLTHLYVGWSQGHARSGGD